MMDENKEKDAIPAEKIAEMKEKYPKSFELIMKFSPDEEGAAGVLMELEERDLDEVFHDVLAGMARRAMAEALSDGLAEAVKMLSGAGEDDEEEDSAVQLFPSGKHYDA